MYQALLIIVKWRERQEFTEQTNCNEADRDQREERKDEQVQLEVPSVVRMPCPDPQGLEPNH